MDKLWLILALAATGAAAAVLLVAYLLTRARSRTLAKQIERYLQTGESLPYSVRDNRFARLHNDVCDLMQCCDNERMNRLRDMRESADFAADISHQLKTPLAGLRLWCELTDEHNGKENAAKELQLIEKMETLVLSLLRLAKVRADAVPFVFAMQPLDGLIGACIDDLRALYPEKRFILRGAATLSCDRMWLTEAIGNLLINACEHTAADGTVDVSLEQTARSVFVTVQDNGGGVPDALLPRLFHRFVTSDSAAPSNTGIGLAISRAIVERHHGSIEAENTAGGLKVTLCFPVLDGAMLTKL